MRLLLNLLRMQLIARLKRGDDGDAVPRDYWRGVVTLTTGASAAQVIGMASMLALARIYTPIDFGGYALFFVCSGLLSLISTGKYDAAVFLSRRPGETAHIALLGALIAAAVGAAVLLLSPLGVRLLGTATREPWLFMFCLALSTVSGGAVLAFTSWATQEKHFRQITFARMLQSASSATISIALGLMTWGDIGLIVGLVAGQVVFVLSLARSLAVISHLRRFTWRAARVRARRNSRFPTFMLASEVLNYVGVTGIQFATPGLFGAAALGQFNLGQRVATIPVSLVGQAMGSVFRSAVSPQHTPPAQVPALFRATFLRLCLVAGVFTLPLLVAGPPIFRIVLGAQWGEAGAYVQILAPLIFARFVVSPLSVLLLLAGRQRFDMFLQGIYAASGMLAIAIGAWFGTFTAMVAAYSVLQVAVLLMYLAISYRLALDLAANP